MGIRTALSNTARSARTAISAGCENLALRVRYTKSVSEDVMKDLEKTKLMTFEADENSPHKKRWTRFTQQGFNKYVSPTFDKTCENMISKKNIPLIKNKYSAEANINENSNNVTQKLQNAPKMDRAIFNQEKYSDQFDALAKKFMREYVNNGKMLQPHNYKTFAHAYRKIHKLYCNKLINPREDQTQKMEEMFRYGSRILGGTENTILDYREQMAELEENYKNLKADPTTSTAQVGELNERITNLISSMLEHRLLSLKTEKGSKTPIKIHNDHLGNELVKIQKKATELSNKTCNMLPKTVTARHKHEDRIARKINNYVNRSESGTFSKSSKEALGKLGKTRNSNTNQKEKGLFAIDFEKATDEEIKSCWKKCVPQNSAHGANSITTDQRIQDIIYSEKFYINDLKKDLQKYCEQFDPTSLTENDSEKRVISENSMLYNFFKDLEKREQKLDQLINHRKKAANDISSLEEEADNLNRQAQEKRKKLDEMKRKLRVVPNKSLRRTKGRTHFPSSPERKLLSAPEYEVTRL